jgi:hypothetical protein
LSACLLAIRELGLAESAFARWTMVAGVALVLVTLAAVLWRRP